jgi:hypothetical protein
MTKIDSALLESVAKDYFDDVRVLALVDRFRPAQSEPAQKPVAWLLQSELDDLLTCNHRGLGADSPTIWAPYDISTPSADMGLVPVYTAPQRPAAPIIQPEIKDDKPFGYFRAEPFGWTDCAPTDEGAIPLYERPQQPPTPPEAQTEAEKVAYCAGWWAAMETKREQK